MSISENNTINTSTFRKDPVEIQIGCMICSEGVSTYIGDFRPKICKKCRDAVMAMRTKMEGERE